MISIYLRKADGYTPHVLGIVSSMKSMGKGLLGLVPQSIFYQAEDAIQKQLGKGSGAWSTAEEAKAIAKFIDKLKLDSLVAIDVGANVGNWSAEIIDLFPSAYILAFEPSKAAFEKLSTRFHDEKNITCLNCALGNSSSISTLYADSSGSGLGSLTNRRVEHFGIDFKHQEKVEVESLDVLLSTKFPDLKPNVLKMDVEGHELDILQGAEKSLLNIQLIQFEFGGSNIDTRTFFQDFWYFFKKANFDIYRLTPVGPRLIKNYSEQEETFRATNYIATRKI